MHAPGAASVQAFFRGCRCRGCRSEFSQYVINGKALRVPVMDVLRHLRRVPGNLKTIARDAAVGLNTLRRIKTRQVAFVRPKTAKRLLSLPPKRHAHVVPSYRTKQLLKAIVAEGWSTEAIAKEIGVDPGALRCRARNIKASTAEKVEALYNRLDADEWTGETHRPRE